MPEVTRVNILLPEALPLVIAAVTLLLPYVELSRLVVCFLLRRPGFESGPNHVGSVMDREQMSQDLSEYSSFLCHLFIQSTALQLALSFRAGTIRQQMDAVIVELIQLQVRR
jgi:hypothetical protein